MSFRVSISQNRDLKWRKSSLIEMYPRWNHNIIYGQIKKQELVENLSTEVLLKTSNYTFMYENSTSVLKKRIQDTCKNFFFHISLKNPALVGSCGESLNLRDSRANAARHHLVYQHKHHVSGGRRPHDDLTSRFLIGRRGFNGELWFGDGRCGTCGGGDSGDDSWVSWGRAMRSVDGGLELWRGKQWPPGGRNLSLRPTLKHLWHALEFF